MSPPPNKRKRTLSQASNVPPDVNPSLSKPLKRSEHLYLEDGNIVLAAEGVAFRVHRSQLSRYSDVFRDMLEVVAQPPDAELFYECPVVRLSDSSEDVLELLRVLYDYVKFDPKKPDQLASVLRLSTKYLIDHLRVATIECLSEAYPATLEKYDRYYTSGFQENGARCSDIIKLAHEVHADILLPAAYYRLCRYPVEEVFTFGLSPSMLQAYYLGKDKMATRLANFVNAQILHRRTDPDECFQPSECQGLIEDIQADTLDMLSETSSISMPNPLDEVQIFTGRHCFYRLCWVCRELLMEDIESERREIWSNLPKFFNIGSWEELLEKSCQS